MAEISHAFTVCKAAPGADEDVEDGEMGTPAKYQPWFSEVTGIRERHGSPYPIYRPLLSGGLL